MAEKIKVVLVEPNKKAIVTEIGATLEDMQAVVGGLIQAMYPFEDEVALICNEEGKLLQLPANRGIRMDGEEDIFDIICGTFFIADCSGERFGSLSEEQIKKYQQKYLFPEKFIKMNDSIKAVPYEVF